MLVPHLLKIYFGLGSLSSVLEIVSSQLPSRCITEVFTELKSAVRSELITKLPVLLGCRVPLAGRGAGAGFRHFYVTVSSHNVTAIAQDVMNVKPQAQSVNY